MKAIVLAAGEGTRLRPYTLDRPKCMVPVEGRSLIDRQLEVFRHAGISDLSLITGYRKESLETYFAGQGIKTYTNADYASTNMLWSLFAAESELHGDLIVSYGDIVFSPRVLRTLLETDGDIVVAIDNNWEHYWRQRSDDFLSDAETLKVQDGKIVEIGQRPQTLADIQGQYIGLVKYSARGIQAARALFHRAVSEADLGGKSPRKAYMTDFLQAMIHEGMTLRPARFEAPWIEVDTVEDLNLPITRERVAQIERELRA